MFASCYVLFAFLLLSIVYACMLGMCSMDRAAGSVQAATANLNPWSSPPALPGDISHLEPGPHGQARRQTTQQSSQPANQGTPAGDEGGYEILFFKHI